MRRILPEDAPARESEREQQAAGAAIDRDLLAPYPDLRIIARYNLGYDDIDLDDCTDLGILVTHAPV